MRCLGTTLDGTRCELPAGGQPYCHKHDWQQYPHGSPHARVLYGPAHKRDLLCLTPSAPSVEEESETKTIKPRSKMAASRPEPASKTRSTSKLSLDEIAKTTTTQPNPGTPPKPILNKEPAAVRGPSTLAALRKTKPPIRTLAFSRSAFLPAKKKATAPLPVFPPTEPLPKTHPKPKTTYTNEGKHPQVQPSLSDPGEPEPRRSDARTLGSFNRAPSAIARLEEKVDELAGRVGRLELETGDIKEETGDIKEETGDIKEETGDIKEEKVDGKGKE
ncbi:hypothetical protein PSPO01_14584 [Paraphaeosphaeria sporulosa]